MSRTVLRPKELNDDTLASRPNNRQCNNCKKWVHKDLLVVHLQGKHEMSLKQAQLAAANNPRNLRTERVAARQQPTPNHRLLIEQLEKELAAANADLTARKEQHKAANSVQPHSEKDGKKRKKMKELFSEIDNWNFPPGSLLTSNCAGRIGRGGGMMSNRRKY